MEGTGGLAWAGKLAAARLGNSFAFKRLSRVGPAGVLPAWVLLGGGGRTA